MKIKDLTEEQKKDIEDWFNLTDYSDDVGLYQPCLLNGKDFLPWALRAPDYELGDGEPEEIAKRWLKIAGAEAEKKYLGELERLAKIAGVPKDIYNSFLYDFWLAGVMEEPLNDESLRYHKAAFMGVYETWRKWQEKMGERFDFLFKDQRDKAESAWALEGENGDLYVYLGARCFL